MRTVNSDFLRSYDKFKDDVFHSKKEEYKQNLRSKSKPLEPLKLKKIFPWKTLTKLTAVAGAVYLAYNYNGWLMDQIIDKQYLNSIDLMALRVLRQDLIVKLKMLISNPQQLRNLSHFSNYMYKSELLTATNYFKKIYPLHKLKSSLNSGLKLWIFQFNNYEKSQYVNEFGDLIQRDEKSFLRIWRYAILKDRKEKVLKEQKVCYQYRRIVEEEDKKGEIQRQIVSKCEQINILNRLSSDYEQLLIQCRKNQSFGKTITKLIQSRKKLYPYTQVKSQVKIVDNQPL